MTNLGKSNVARMFAIGSATMIPLSAYAGEWLNMIFFIVAAGAMLIISAMYKDMHEDEDLRRYLEEPTEHDEDEPIAINATYCGCANHSCASDKQPNA